MECAEDLFEESLSLAAILLPSCGCSWAGIIDIHKHPVELAETLWGWEQWNVAWDNADVLVLDEISMVDCDLLEAVCTAGAEVQGPGFQGWG